MNNLDLEGNKLFYDSETQSNKDSEVVIAKVISCLTDHHTCTGCYTDFSLRYSIICVCACHNITARKETGKN
jgi:hypothetical protein